MSSSNVVALPPTPPSRAPTPPAPAQQSGAPAQAMYPPWAMNPIYPIPPGPWSGAPGCAPGCPPSSLMQCYCDIQNAQAFLSAMMIDLINNNPAVAQAMITAIEQSGSALPLVGVTNGSAAQPGQVGEYLQLSQTLNLPTGSNTMPVTLGQLAPGDWDVWAYSAISAPATYVQIQLNPLPAGFSNNMEGQLYSPTTAESLLLTNTVMASTSVPSLLAMTVVTNLTAAGSMILTLAARRRR